MAIDTKISSVADIAQLGTILGVWAHPDDESFSCAGIMAAAVQNGQTVACVTATRGEAGVQDPKRWPPERLGDIRAAEMATALGIIGITNHHWLGYPDGQCNQVPEIAAIAEISQFIAIYKPDTILTFGPDGLTGHPDHQTVSHWAHQAASQAVKTPIIYHVVMSKRVYDQYLKAADEKYDIFFNIEQPPLRQEQNCDICFCLPKELVEKKFAALAAMPSQTEQFLASTPVAELVESFGTECFERVDC